MFKPPTIEDVAKSAGVSKSTVSRVLNSSAKISEQTIKRVLEAVQELNYEPNNIARSLSKKKTHTIGVVVEDILNTFFTEVVGGIETTLKKAGYSMFLTNTAYDYEDEIKLTRMLMRNKVDGVLITPVKSDSEALSLLKERKVPFFVINCRCDHQDIDWIVSDNIQGGYIATKYLIELGHRKLMHLRGVNIQSTNDRLEGFRKAVLESGLKLSDMQVIGNAKFIQDGYDVMKKYIKKQSAGSFPTAIFAVNDVVAIGAIAALNEHGIGVPEDVSIIGYDDISIASLVRVPLTTVLQTKFKMGEIAAAQLIDKIERKEKRITRQFLIRPELVIRKSCKRLS
ncbi:MAG: LacI family DNA-binding transcriptional regulator [Spirochaetes bacterium]|nr:LacI family DNA-binding transcriptional regulator [Spirochaetota bacterium]